MKTNKNQSEKGLVKTKTKSPHSIGVSVASNVSKKSHAIQKQAGNATVSVQSKLVSVNNANGTKSLTVSKVSTPVRVGKVHGTRQSKTASVVSKPATQVESKKTVGQQMIVPKKEPTSNASKPIELQMKNVPVAKSISCMYCNLHFSTIAWLNKHIARCHSKQVDKSKVDPKVKILKYKQQLEDIQQTLDKESSKEKQSKKKPKVSPTKQKLREQLKEQLAAQQRLLQVQQEIFEKTSKAQQDIFSLIAKLGDDSDAEGTDAESQPSEEEEQESINEVKYEDSKAKAHEIYLEAPEMGELIVSENVEEYGYLPDTYGMEEQLIATDENNYMLLNNQNEYIEADQTDAAVMVVVRSEDGEEEYELVDVVEDQMYENIPIEHMENGIDFEVVGNDSNSLHCRIVAHESQREEIEYVDIQMDQKVPVKLEVDKIQQIAQKRFKKQLMGDKNVDDESDTKLLNSTVNKSTKQTNEYIQKVVQNATPTEDNKFECPICHELVSNRYSLGPHILRLHSKQKSKICQYCDRSFTCTGDLTRHIRIHTGEKPFKCSYPNCTYAFRASGDLHKHMRRHNSTTVNIRQHVCKLCDRAFERNYDLKRHELTHKKNEEGVGYNCEFCSKRFVRKDQHKAHVYRHLGIKQYKCPDCNRKFSDFSNCSKHIRQCQDGDVKPFGSDDNGPQFICEICDKRFKSKVGMKQHVVKCAQITEMQRKLQESFKQMEDN